VRRNAKVKKAAWVVVGCLTIGAFLLFTGRHAWQKDGVERHIRVKTVHYRYLIRNSTDQPVPEARFFVRAPARLTGTQECLRIESSHSHEIATDASGGQVLEFTFANFPPYASKTISIRATLSLASVPTETLEADPRRFSAPMTGDDAQGDRIRQLAARLKSKRVSDTASNIYRWVADNIEYTGYSSKAKGAARTFVDRQGDCTEFADLFVALSRAVGIPARRVSGYYAPDTNILKPMNSHDWAEFYEDGAWRIADPQQRNFNDRYSEYIATKIYAPVPASGPFDGFHRFFVHGSGLKVKMDS